MNAFDRNVIDGAVNGIGQATGAVGAVLERVQSGKVQQYAAVLFAVVAILALVVHGVPRERANERWEKSAVSLAVFLPTAGAVVISFLPKDRDRLIRALGILFTGAALVVGIVMLFGFDYGAHGACSSS